MLMRPNASLGSFINEHDWLYFTINKVLNEFGPAIFDFPYCIVVIVSPFIRIISHDGKIVIAIEAYEASEDIRRDILGGRHYI